MVAANDSAAVARCSRSFRSTGRIKVIHGPNDEIFDGLVGHQVATVERSLVDAFNIPPGALAFVNGEPVEREYRLQANETLEFALPSGSKGVLEPEELSILERLAAAAERIASALENTTQTAVPGGRNQNRLRLDAAPPGTPGRRNETEEIAIFANELRTAGKSWKEVFATCKQRWPGDSRVGNVEQIRQAWRRHFREGRKNADET